jgi:hypothetical protein
MFGEGTTVIISAKEAMRSESTRLQVYKLAVQNGFYNEGPETVAYRGFQIMPEGHNFLVMQKGFRLITLGNLHVAKVWITCRLDGVGLMEAQAKVKAEG